MNQKKFINKAYSVSTDKKLRNHATLAFPKDSIVAPGLFFNFFNGFEK